MRRDDGLLQLRLKTPWRDGTTHLVLDEFELVQKVAALVPPPRCNLVTYHGVLAPAAKWRSLVVPEPPEAVKHCRHRNGSVHDAWVPWKLLLQRTFGVNAMKCPACGSKLEVRAVVRGAWHAGKLLGVLGMPADASLPFARDGPA